MMATSAVALPASGEASRSPGSVCASQSERCESNVISPAGSRSRAMGAARHVQDGHFSLDGFIVLVDGGELHAHDAGAFAADRRIEEQHLTAHAQRVAGTNWLEPAQIVDAET